MRATPIICVDDSKTALAEDGFYIHQAGKVSTLRLAAVAVYGEDALVIDRIERMLGKGKEERFALGNPKMCKQDVVDKLNFRLDADVPAVIADINFEEETETISGSVYLDYVKAFKHYTYKQAGAFLDSGQGTFGQVNYFLGRLRLCGYAETLKGWDDYQSLTREENFVRRLIWLFNEICTTTARGNGVPVIGKKDRRSRELEVTETSIPIFNCPVRHPVAAINNYNLVHFLEHGKSYFKTRDLKKLLRQS